MSKMSFVPVPRAVRLKQALESVATVTQVAARKQERQREERQREERRQEEAVAQLMFTKNLWAFFHSSNLINIFTPEERTMQDKPEKIEIIKILKESLEKKYIININNIIMKKIGLIVEFTYTKPNGTERKLHATFHNINQKKEEYEQSPSHISYDFDDYSENKSKYTELKKSRLLNLTFNYSIDGGNLIYINLVPVNFSVSEYIQFLKKNELDTFDADDSIYLQKIIDILNLLFKTIHEKNYFDVNRKGPVDRLLQTQKSVNERIKVDKIMRKYLKYKQKYLELKALMENMNLKN